MEIKSLSGTGFNTIFKAFSLAFADYELQQNKKQLQDMLKRRGFNPGLSFAAFDNNEIVAFTLNGIGNFNGTPTAYDTGTGTLKEYRGKGLATKIFEYSIPYLKRHNIKQYLLEVLQHNTKATSVYRNLGFQVTREFNYFRQDMGEINNQIPIYSFPYIIQKIDINNFSRVSEFWDFYPSWQNNFESVQRKRNDFISLGVFAQNQIIGYGIFEPDSGDITQIAVKKQHRRKGIASYLLSEMMKINKNTSIKIINTDINCHSITAFLNKKNINPAGRQFEMIKKI